MHELTTKQEAVMDFILNHIKEYNQPPTIREIADEFQMTGPAAVGFLNALQRKGHVERTAGSRGIKLKKHRVIVEAV